ncbi:hypothetical protein [Rickettsia peacockii]|uniref:hypothetical protein n=1 Tax=Rickettsia peacockii TaxID=47589 RepID=UPI000A100B67|nr:hypothetical protein [Rickettsia peacockii]
MNELIQEKNGNPIRDNEVFDKGWNAMCKIEPEKLTEIYNLQHRHINFISTLYVIIRYLRYLSQII